MAQISILCNDGSPLKVTERTIYGDDWQLGVGGAELFILTMCRAWHEAGHKVILFNDPREIGVSCFEQRPVNEFDGREDNDFVIVFRSPNERIKHAKGKKIWLSCDQQTVGDFKNFATKVDKIVTISQFHAEYFRNRYEIENTTVIDIPVREWDYTEKVDKVPLQVLFCSIPDRGAIQLAEVWKRVTDIMPEAQLHITSDWRLWDSNVSENLTRHYRLQFAKFNNVTYHAAVPRKELVKLQQQSAIHLYPGIYEELFCIAAAECQWAGCYPITSFTGALATTNIGVKINAGDYDVFADICTTQLRDPDYGHLADITALARGRFSIQHVLDQWNNSVFNY